MLRFMTVPVMLTVAFVSISVRADAPDMNQVRETLAQFEGEFKAVVTVGSDKIAGQRTAKWNKGTKHYLVSEEVYDSGPSDEEKFSVNILEGWDPSTQTVKQFMFSSEGANSTTHFKIVENRLIGLRSGIDADGTRWTANVELKPIGQNGFDLYINKWRTDTGEERPDVTVAFRRK